MSKFKAILERYPKEDTDVCQSVLIEYDVGEGRTETQKALLSAGDVCLYELREKVQKGDTISEQDLVKLSELKQSEGFEDGLDSAYEASKD